MHQRPLITRKTVNVAAWSLLASMALALTLIACGPGPTTGPTPTGDVTITVTVVGDGRAMAGALDFTCSDTCTLVVDEGTDVALAAVPNAGRVLVAWDAPCSPFADTCAWRADEDVAVTVTFAPHALRFDLQGDGEGLFRLLVDEFVSCDSACGLGVDQPQEVSISHQVGAGNRTILEPWDADCLQERTETLSFCVVFVEGITEVGKVWRYPPIAEDQVYLTMQGTLLTVAAPGVLADVDDTPGDTHTASLLTQPANGTVVLAADGSFTYEPNAGFTGDDEFTFRVTDAFGNPSDGTATVTVSLLPTLAVVTSGDGSGTVTSVPTGIDTAGGDTSASFAEGTEIELTAAPDENSDFTGWTGVTCDEGNDADTCTFTFTTSTTVTAVFTPINHTLIVTTSGDGTGNVTSSPPGINLTVGDDVATFQQGTEIVLTAASDPANTFIEWTGDHCAGEATLICTFTITEDTDIAAVFRSNRTLTVTTSGDGTGNVTSTPTGINYAAGDDVATFTHGEEIELTAHPDSDSDLDEWSGVTCDEGDDEGTCTFILIQDTTVDAEFDD